jgi:excisionase family DNA binding protein
VTAALTLTVAEVADVLRVSRSSVYDGVRRGDIPNVGVGSRVSIPRVWLEERFEAAGAPLPSKVVTVGSGVFT